MEKNIYSAPESNLENNDSSESVDATRISRLLASFVDGLTILPFTAALMYFTGGFDGFKEGVQPSFSYTLIMGLIGIGIFVLMHGKIMIRDGQTWGKKAFNIKMVSLDGSNVTGAMLLKRYSFYWLVPQVPVAGQILSMINILFIFGKTKRCLHDYIAGTRVVVAK